MARDTDRKLVSEALRLRNRPARLWTSSWGTDYRGLPQLTVTDFETNELNITFSPAGRIVHVAHWAVVEGTNGCASRQPITVRKRERVLEIIRGVVL
jgi:hypothetical protein